MGLWPRGEPQDLLFSLQGPPESGDACLGRGKGQRASLVSGVRTGTGTPKECGHLGLLAPQLFPTPCFFHPLSLAGRISVSLCKLGENVSGSHCISVQSGKRTNLPKAHPSHTFSSPSPSPSPTSSIMGSARQAWLQTTSKCVTLRGSHLSLGLSSSTVQLRQSHASSGSCDDYIH